MSRNLRNTTLGVDGAAGAAFTIEGETLARYAPNAEVSGVYAIDLDGDCRDEVLTLGTMYAIGTNLSAFTAEGKLLWSILIEIDDDWLKHPLFGMNINGKTEIGVATKAGVSFYSSEGEKRSKIAIEISGAAQMPHQGISDRLLLRGPGFLKCIELPVTQ